MPSSDLSCGVTRHAGFTLLPPALSACLARRLSPNTRPATPPSTPIRITHTPLGRRARPSLSLAALLVAVLTLAAPVRAQTCSGNISLSSQAEVDAFDCAEITGSLFITGPDITTLAGLSELTSVGTTGGALYVANNPLLESLGGLSGLTSVGGSLRIEKNGALRSLDGLSGLTSLAATLYIAENPLLESISSLSGLTSLPLTLIVGYNPSLQSLDGLENVTSVYSTVSIGENPSLQSFDGLSGLTSVGGDLRIESNASVTSLSGLENVTTVGSRLRIESNASLSECSCGLAGVISGDPPVFSGVGSFVSITNNDADGACASPEAVLATPCVTPPFNAAPVIAGVTVPADPVAVGVAAAVSAPFIDTDVDDTHTCSIDYGDGTTAAGTVIGLTCAGAHAYLAAGVYTVAVTVTDAAGESDTEAGTDYVVVYDPSAGFVTGGGWIDSPEGAYPADPTLTGRASFGFVAKYKRGQSTPDGNTQFQFNAAGLSFHSTAYDWLVIAGPNAKFKGTGTIDGVGDYGFMLTAADADADLFRIKIWDRADGDAVVYDNRMGEGNDSNAGTELGGGQIMIHSTGGRSATGGSSASRGSEGTAPGAFALQAAYPNPFTKSATLGYEVPEAADVRVVVYDVLGREVATLVDGPVEEGRHEVVFEAAGLPAGAFLVRMTAKGATGGGFSRTQRVALVR